MVDLLQVSAKPVIIQSVAYHKFIGDLKTHMRKRQWELGCLGFVQQGNNGK